MSKPVINIIFIVAFAYPALRFIYKYLILLLFSVIKREKFEWNKEIDKPRILFYLAFSFLAGLLWYILVFQTIQPLGKLQFLSDIIQSIFIIGAIRISLILNETWTMRFDEISIIREIKSLVSTQLRCIIRDDDKIKELHQALNNNYINCTFPSFYAFIKQKHLGKLPKIIWIDFFRNKANRQTLIELVTNLFPGLYKKDGSLDRITLENVIHDYFCEEDGSPIILGKKPIDKFIEKTTEPKEKIKTLVKSFISAK